MTWVGAQIKGRQPGQTCCLAKVVSVLQAPIYSDGTHRQPVSQGNPEVCSNAGQQ